MPLDLIVLSVDTAMPQHSMAYLDDYVKILKERAAPAYKEVMMKQGGVVRHRGQREAADKLDPEDMGDKVHIFSARDACHPAAKLRPHWEGL